MLVTSIFSLLPRMFKKETLPKVNKTQDFELWFNFIPNNKILARSKLKALADDKIDMIKKLQFVSRSRRVEDILGKRENAGYQHFLHFQKSFQKPSSSGTLKVGIVRYSVKHEETIIIIL